MIWQRSFWQREYSNQEHLGNLQFMQMIVLALAAHLIGVAIWYIVPREAIEFIPVRVLNIKLGQDTIDAMANSQVDSTAIAMEQILNPTKMRDPNRIQMEAPEKRIVEEKKAVPTERKPEPAPKHTERAQSMTESVLDQALSAAMPPRQYVRDQGGSPFGNSTEADAVVVQRYTELVSLAILRQKAAFDARISVDTKPKGVMRVRIDRKGYVLYSAIEQSTGSENLDQIMREMVARANPLPAAPTDYPGGKLEFLVTILF